MKAFPQRESVVTYVKSCLIFQIPRFMLISKYRVISPLSSKVRVIGKMHSSVYDIAPVGRELILTGNEHCFELVINHGAQVLPCHQRSKS